MTTQNAAAPSIDQVRAWKKQAESRFMTSSLDEYCPAEFLTLADAYIDVLSKAPTPSEGVVEPQREDVDDRLHKAIQKLRSHVEAIQCAKRVGANAGPIYACVNDLPAIIAELDAAELEIEADFERYEDASPTHQASDVSGHGLTAENVADLRVVAGWIEELSANEDIHQVVADGGVTAAMVFQQDARGMARRMRSALFGGPVATEKSALVESLRRQTDNMAFVLNRVDLHAWHGKFEAELAVDRLALAQAQQVKP